MLHDDEASGQLWLLRPQADWRRVEPATAIAGALAQLYRSNPVVARVNWFIPQPTRTNPPAKHCTTIIRN